MPNCRITSRPLPVELHLFGYVLKKFPVQFLGNGEIAMVLFRYIEIHPGMLLIQNEKLFNTDNGGPVGLATRLLPELNPLIYIALLQLRNLGIVLQMTNPHHMVLLIVNIHHPGSRIKVRSEERRVGKECRCRWWSYH